MVDHTLVNVEECICKETDDNPWQELWEQHRRLENFNHSLRAELAEDDGNPYWYNQTDKDKAEIVENGISSDDKGIFWTKQESEII